MYPHYSYPGNVLWGLARDVLLDRHRSFACDAQGCLARLHPPLRVSGAQDIPSGGCYVITPNHYFRPGFAAQWSALAISASILTPVHWVMTAELTYADRWIAPMARPISRLVLARIARVYGFTTMPAMPPRPRDAAECAAAVRRALRYAAGRPDAVIGLAPEGGDQPGGRLSLPPAGAGRFCLKLAELGLHFLPVGIYENAGELALSFGQPYDLHAAGVTTSAQKDRLAAEEVMSHIAALLPSELRGEWGNAGSA